MRLLKFAKQRLVCRYKCVLPIRRGYSLESGQPMKKREIFSLLETFYNDTIESDTAWETYQNFYDLYSSGDQPTVDYMYGVISMGTRERLMLRSRIAEKGFELTPNQLDQYIFLLFLAIYDMEKYK